MTLFARPGSSIRQRSRRPSAGRKLPVHVLALLWIALFTAALGAAPARSLSTDLAAITVQTLEGKTTHPLTNDGRKASVFFFVMHECPVANSYAPEISRIISEYGGRGIRSYVVYFEDDLKPETARAHARDYGYKSGVLLDPEHRLVQATGATVSPEAAVLSPSGELLYRGRIDDRVADFGKRRVEPTRRDLRLALDAILAGRQVPTRLTRAVGCYIPENHKPPGKGQ